MSAKKAGVDALESMRRVLEEAQESIRGERLNDTSRALVAVAVACLSMPMPRDGWIRQSAEARQWLKEARDFDKADADRILADVQKKLAEIEKKRSRAANLVA